MKPLKTSSIKLEYVADGYQEHKFGVPRKSFDVFRLRVHLNNGVRLEDNTLVPKDLTALEVIKVIESSVRDMKIEVDKHQHLLNGAKWKRKTNRGCGSKHATNRRNPR